MAGAVLGFTRSSLSVPGDGVDDVLGTPVVRQVARIVWDLLSKVCQPSVVQTQVSARAVHLYLHLGLSRPEVNELSGHEVTFALDRALPEGAGEGTEASTR